LFFLIWCSCSLVSMQFGEMGETSKIWLCFVIWCPCYLFFHNLVYGAIQNKQLVMVTVVCLFQPLVSFFPSYDHSSFLYWFDLERDSLKPTMTEHFSNHETFCFIRGFCVTSNLISKFQGWHERNNLYIWGENLMYCHSMIYTLDYSAFTGLSTNKNLQN
jgi:hypothetical protein